MTETQIWLALIVVLGLVGLLGGLKIRHDQDAHERELWRSHVDRARRQRQDGQSWV